MEIVLWVLGATAYTAVSVGVFAGALYWQERTGARTWEQHPQGMYANDEGKLALALLWPLTLPCYALGWALGHSAGKVVTYAEAQGREHRHQQLEYLRALETIDSDMRALCDGELAEPTALVVRRP